MSSTRLPSPRGTGSDSLADQVFAWLTDQIVAGVLRPGQWVSENEIATRLGVSRSPVREALRGLAREGLVEVRPRRGTIIAELNAEDADGLYRARELVESELARLAVENATDADVETIAAIVRDLQKAKGDTRAHYDATMRLWQLMMDLCPNRTLSEIAAILWRRSIRFRGILLGIPESQKDVRDFSKQLLQYARKRDGEAAGRATGTLLARVRQTLLEQVFMSIGDGGRVQRPLA
jgi:DNA-binding GntR family transcriptional regulator